MEWKLKSEILAVLLQEKDEKPHVYFDTPKTEQELLAEGVEAFEESVERKKSAVLKGARAFKQGLNGKNLGNSRKSRIWSGVSYTTC